MNIKQETLAILDKFDARTQRLKDGEEAAAYVQIVEDTADQIDTLYRNKMLELVPPKKTLKINGRIIPSNTEGMDSLLSEYTKGFNAAIDKFTDNITSKGAKNE